MLKHILKNDKYQIELPSLTYGVADFDRNDNDEAFFELLDRYVELGGSCIDTARVYCDWLENGHNASEGVVGRWLSARNCRDKVIIATKGGHPAMEHMDENRLSRAELTKDLNESLECLGVEYIDIYFVHRDDPAVPVSDIMPVLNDFYESGKIHFIGVSNWTVDRIEAANKYAEENGLEPIRVSQISYSLAHASVETLGDKTLVCMDSNEFQWYKKHNFPVMAFSPQAKGFFAKFARGDAAKNFPESQYASTSNLAKLARVKQLSEKTGVTPAVVPLGYLNSQPFFVSSVFAVSKMWQLEEDMEGQDLQYSPMTVAYLENII